MAGQRQKAPEFLTNGRGGRGRGLPVVAREKRVVPTAPMGLGLVARRRWRRFFLSWVADAVNLDSDAEALSHWIMAVDERSKLSDVVRKAPLVRGAHSQLMQNPLRRTLRELSKEIARAEEHFGMTPLARFRLQMTYAESESARAALAWIWQRREPWPGDAEDGQPLKARVVNL